MNLYILNAKRSKIFSQDLIFMFNNYILAMKVVKSQCDSNQLLLPFPNG